MRTRLVDRARLTSALLAASIVVSSCSSSAVTTTGSTTTASASTTASPTTTALAATTVAPTATSVPALVTTFPSCDDEVVIPQAVGAGEVGFVAGGLVYVSDPIGANVQCVTGIDGDGPLLWGPAGDRLLAGSALITNTGSVPALAMDTPTWSRPTGTSLIWTHNGRLYKAGSDQSVARDNSFLARHDAVTYHPAGFEIATTGQAEDGTHGIWLANNDGSDPQLIVRADEATPHQFTFTQDGRTAYFLADHGDHWHVHNIFLVLPDDNPTANEFDATIEYESKRPLSHLVVSPWQGLWAVRDGTCGSGSHVVINGGISLPAELADVDAYPVGWLPDETLVVAALPDGCDDAADIWLINDVLQGSPSASLLVTDVAAAATRAAVPDPPSALGDLDLDEFA